MPQGMVQLSPETENYVTWEVTPELLQAGDFGQTYNHEAEAAKTG